MKASFKYYGDKKITENEILKYVKKAEQKSNENLNELKILGNIECIFPDKKEYIELGELVGKEEKSHGGEGAVFKTNMDGLVAKIYWPKMRSKVREEKLTIMVNNQISNDKICWPRGVLKYKGKFVGFVMPYIDNKTYEEIDPYYNPNYKDFFKDDKRNVLKSLINIMEIFEVLKENNIVMGDINFNNFLFNKNTFEVKLIDIDGAQIDKYPCVTCTEHFNAPEIFPNIEDEFADEEEKANNHYHNKYSTFLRDNYSLAVFAFIMLINKPPFKTIVHLTKHNFGYNLTDNKFKLNKNLIEPHLYRWMHLPSFVREAFYKCFTTKNPNERLTPKQWKTLFKYYYKLLDNNTLKEKDSECLILYIPQPINLSVLGDIKMILSNSLYSRGFTMEDTVKKLLINLKKNGIKSNADTKMISEYLKHNRILKIDNITYKLLFNIGVYKKISLEYKTNQI